MNNKVLYFAGGVVVGGIAGYLAADLLIYKFLQEQEEWDPDLFVKDKEPPSEEWQVEKDTRPRVDYTSIEEKGDLEELAAQYSEVTSPHIISLETWSDNDWGWDQVVITFYSEDSIFAFSDEEQIEEPQNLFGPNIHLHFGEGEGNDDPDVVYVAAPHRKTLFEILRVHESYGVQVLGEVKKDNAGRPRDKKGRFQPKDGANEE